MQLGRGPGDKGRGEVRGERDLKSIKMCHIQVPNTYNESSNISQICANKLKLKNTLQIF